MSVEVVVEQGEERQHRLQVERRHLPYGGCETTVALERCYWSVVDALALKEQVHWSVWVSRCLDRKPVGIGRAGWLRVVVLDESKRAGIGESLPAKEA